MTFAKDILDKIKSEKKKDSTQSLLDKSNGSLLAIAIGAGVGLVIGYTRSYPLFVSSLVGGIIGGLTSKVLMPKETKDESK